jgi:hypothetical protein
MDETDFRKLAIATPFSFSEIKTAYDLFCGLGISDSKAETLLSQAMKTAVDSRKSLCFVADQYCNAVKGGRQNQ